MEGAAQNGSSLLNHTAGPLVEAALQALADAAGSGATAKDAPDEATEVSTERKEGSMAHQQVGTCSCLGPCTAADTGLALGNWLPCCLMAIRCSSVNPLCSRPAVPRGWLCHVGKTCLCWSAETKA